MPNSLSTSFYRQEIYEAAKLTKAEVTILHRKAKVFSFIEKDSWSPMIFSSRFEQPACGDEQNFYKEEQRQITTLGGVHLRGTSQYFQVGTVSILVNNAGIVSGTALLDTPDARSLFSDIFKE